MYAIFPSLTPTPSAQEADLLECYRQNFKDGSKDGPELMDLFLKEKKKQAEKKKKKSEKSGEKKEKEEKREKKAKKKDKKEKKEKEEEEDSGSARDSRRKESARSKEESSDEDDTPRPTQIQYTEEKQKSIELFITSVLNNVCSSAARQPLFPRAKQKKKPWETIRHSNTGTASDGKHGLV